MAKQNKTTKPETKTEEPALDPANIGAGDDTAPATNESPVEGAEQVTLASVADDSLAGSGSSEQLPPADNSPPPEPRVMDYKVFFKGPRNMEEPAGYMQRTNFTLDAESACKLNSLMHAMMKENVIGPTGVKVDSPVRALAALIHIAHDSFAE